MWYVVTCLNACSWGYEVFEGREPFYRSGVCIYLDTCWNRAAYWTDPVVVNVGSLSGGLKTWRTVVHHCELGTHRRGQTGLRGQWRTAYGTLACSGGGVCNPFSYFTPKLASFPTTPLYIHSNYFVSFLLFSLFFIFSHVITVRFMSDTKLFSYLYLTSDFTPINYS